MAKPKTNLHQSNLFAVHKKDNEAVIALAGNPNVGKSTVFNMLTGKNQHTGNWAGKTVGMAYGRCGYAGKKYIITDLPGTYSLMTHSKEEEVSRDFLCFSGCDAVIAVCDATCLERNLNLVIQICEITKKVVVCINLMDEAAKKGIEIDTERLEKMLGVKVIAVSAAQGKCGDIIMSAAADVIARKASEFNIVEYDDKTEYVTELVSKALNDDMTVSRRYAALRIIEDKTGNTAGTSRLIREYAEAHAGSIEFLNDRIQAAAEFLAENNISQSDTEDLVTEAILHTAEKICKECVSFKNDNYNECDRRIDRIITSRRFGIPIMILMLGIILYITIIGANYPSEFLSRHLFALEEPLYNMLSYISVPEHICDMTVYGVYRVLAWVVSVMLPPMAIFFPLFTILEDVGFLPRVAFNLDKYFKKVCACGKQSLTMCMGFGCNSVGIIGCRIIDSPRERLIAMITNSFVPCNGKFPALITLISVFFVFSDNRIAAALQSSVIITMIILGGIAVTLAASLLLSKTVLKGIPSSFTLELPPYRKPQFAKVIIRSILERTIFVLARAVIVSLPAGLIIWILSNCGSGGVSFLKYMTDFLDPFAVIMGLDGVILAAFILGLPANEIILPLILMAYLANSNLTDISDLSLIRNILSDNGWTIKTAVCTIAFYMMHWPCSTACISAYKETKSIKQTFAVFALPTLFGICVCMLLNFVLGIFI
ncbi:MAG: ferrous iron transport protein B [Oscillospiraceae bacterium]|nr:ferrous iron transport protein B [Oscillospiraceae bacterium]